MGEVTDIRALNLQDIQQKFQELSLPAYRSRQVWEWLWKKGVRNFSEMSSLPLDLRSVLSQKFSILPAALSQTEISKDGTIKCALKLHDGHMIESVLIPSRNRVTACISSQAGCSLTCTFCATGKLKLMRNLTAGEIYDQVVFLQALAFDKYKENLSNIVLMGMGEPLLNYREVLDGIQKITSPEGLGISSQRITLSTAGIAKMIKKLGDDEVKFNLAISLHAASDEKRNKIMPINESNNLSQLTDALQYFYNKTGTRVTYEYIAFQDFNDSLGDAEQLAALCRKVPSKVNMIQYNPIGDEQFRQATLNRLTDFKNYLERKGIIVNVRRSRGKDINAACGQLANKPGK